MKKELTTEELKTVIFQILLYFRDLCQTLDLKYYLMGGTLLGAVRHGGFIPWDDDIDVMMPRSDYDKLVTYYSEHKNDRYYLMDWKLDKEYSLPIGKLIDTETSLVSNTMRTGAKAGAFIDIFPLDRIKDKDDLAQRREKLGALNTYINVFGRMLPEDYKEEKSKWSWKEALVYYSHGIHGWRRMISEYEKICREYNAQETDYSAYISWLLYERELWTDDVLGEGVPVQFEGEEFTAPTQYDQFLTTVYGDYMQLPPEEKRITRHNFTVYRND